MRFMMKKIRRSGAGLVALVAIGCVQNRHAQIEKTPIASEQGGWLRKFPYLTSNTSRHAVFDDPSQWPAKPPESVVQSRFAQMFPNLSRRTSNRSFDGQTTIAAVTAQDLATATSETESARSESTPPETEIVAEAQPQMTAASESTGASEPAVRPLSKSEWANLSASSAGVAAVVAALAATSDIDEAPGASSASPSSESAISVPSHDEPKRAEEVQIAARPMPDRVEAGKAIPDDQKQVATIPVMTAAEPRESQVPEAAKAANAATSEVAATLSDSPPPPAAETIVGQVRQTEMTAESAPQMSSLAASTTESPASVPASPTPSALDTEIPAIPATVAATTANVATESPSHAQRTAMAESAPEIPSIPAVAQPAPAAPVNPAPDVPPIPASALPMAGIESAQAREIPAIPASPVQPKPAPEIPAKVETAPVTEVPATQTTTSPMLTAERLPAPEIPSIPAPAPVAPANPAPEVPPIPAVPALAAQPESNAATANQVVEATAASPSAEQAAALANPPITSVDRAPAPSIEPAAPQGNLAIPAVPEGPGSSPVPTSNEPTPVVPGLANRAASLSGIRAELPAMPEIPPLPPAPAELPGMLNEPPLPPPAPEMKIPGIGDSSSGTDIPVNADIASSPTDTGIEKSSGAMPPEAQRPDAGATQEPETNQTAGPVANPGTETPKLEQAPESSPAADPEIPVLNPLPDDETASNGEPSESIVQRKPGEIVIQLRLKNPLRLSRFRPALEEDSVPEKATRSLKSAAKNLFAWQRWGRTGTEPAGESTTNANAATDLAANGVDRPNSPVEAEVVPPNANDEVATQTSQVPHSENSTKSADPAEVGHQATAPATAAVPSVAEASQAQQGDSDSAVSPSGGAAYYVPGRSVTDSPKIRSNNGLPPVEFPSSYHSSRPRSANPWHAHSNPAVNLVSDPRSGIAPAPPRENPAPAAAETLPVTRNDAWPKMKPDLEVVRTSLNVAAPRVVPARTIEPVEPRASQSSPSWWSKSGKGLRSMLFGEEEVVPAKRPNWAKQPSSLR